MATRYCQNCGQPLTDDTRFCPECGNPVPPINPTPEPQYAQQPQQPPQPSQTRPLATRPKTYLALAILATIFCCLPFGIPAIVFAAKVDNLWNAGLYTEAGEASRKAKTWVLVSIISSIVIGIAYSVLVYLGMLAGVFDGLN